MEDFYDVAAARLAELSPEVDAEEAPYAEDTPTPRLVVIAENIDSVCQRNTHDDDEDDDEEDDDDLTESKTEVSDSGVNDLSSTAATTPEESNIFSPQPTKPAGSDRS